MNDESLRITERRYKGETEVLSARLPGDLVKALSDIARDTGRSRNEIIEKCLTYAVSRLQIEKGA